MKWYAVYYTVQTDRARVRRVWRGYAHDGRALVQAFRACEDIHIVETGEAA